jgi:uncharacterized protein
VRRLLPLLLLGLLLAGCGEEDVRDAREDLRAQVDELRDDAERFREEARDAGRELGERVREVLDEIRKAVPEASLPTPEVERESQIGAYLTQVLRSVDGYWTRTLTGSGLSEPQVRFLWVRRPALSACRVVADDRAAFYCPADDTIYIAEKLASDVYSGIADGLPGQQAGQGKAVGEFGLAYLVAHEYAHNVQFELGFYELADPRDGVKAFELQADCMAGLWGNAVYREGRYDDRDVQEAISTAQAVGDFDFGNAQHHGTPEERRAAWLDGFQSGDPGRCQRYVPL